MPEPYYQHDGVTLYHGDCLEILPTFEAGSMDAVITDPPYGIGFKYGSYLDTSDNYVNWLWAILEIAENICNPGSPLFIWQAMPNCRNFSEWFPRDYRIFAACKNFVQMRPTEMQYAYDPVIVWWTPAGEPFYDGTLSRDWYVANTNPSSHTGLNDGGGHPCPRPLDAMKHIIYQWAKPGGLVLDPFTGSGTTGVACVQLGRRFVGIEIEERYCEIAAKRLQQAQRQMRMF